MSTEPGYELITTGAGVPIKAWTRGVPLEEAAARQLRNVAQMPFVHGWVAVMPDVHYGIGATVGSVIPTKGAIIPAAVGVDIGCGMMAVETSLTANDLPGDLKPIRHQIERDVPLGRNGWHDVPSAVASTWAGPLSDGYEALKAAHPVLGESEPVRQLGSLGGGNHFIEVCLDERDRVWIMLHSGSRGIGNRIGTYFIDRARRLMDRLQVTLPDRDLAYLAEETPEFDAYMQALQWAQQYAQRNREVMMRNILHGLSRGGPRIGLPPFTTGTRVNCHHNYVARETHFGEELWVTRKGAVRAREDDLGIIPGSMGARSYIVRGKGNPESFTSCSHGAGRAMSRAEAKRRFTLQDHAAATAHVECRKDEAVIDETPMAYKPIDAVMRAQQDLVEVVHELHQVVCVKG